MAQASSSAAGNPAQNLPEQYNVTAAFLDGALAQGWGNRPAIRTQTEAVTYTQLAEQANRAGNGLSALGVEMEQRVALLLYDSPEFAASFFGAMRLGAVAVPFNTNCARKTISICSMTAGRVCWWWSPISGNKSPRCDDRCPSCGMSCSFAVTMRRLARPQHRRLRRAARWLIGDAGHRAHHA